MSNFFELSSCSKLSIISDSISVYKRNQSYVPETDEKQGYDYVKRVETVNKKNVSEYYKKASEKIHISKVRLTPEGLVGKVGSGFSVGTLMYPFLKLKGDDYRVKDFNNSFKIFCNENSLGLFRKDTEDSMLLSRVMIRKIHKFINDDSMNDFE